MSTFLRGIFLAILAGATFGLIPLFAIPVIKDGVDYNTVIFYRFLLGAVGMLAVLIYRQNSLRINFSDAWRISILAFIYVICAITLFKSYEYIASGISTALIYTNPIWCALIGVTFLRGETEGRSQWGIWLPLLMSVLGVAMLSGAFTQGGDIAFVGILLGLTSGIGYAIYLVAMPRLSIRKMPSLKLNFYIFLFAAFFQFLYCLTMGGGVEPIHCSDCFISLMLLGLIPTAFSNICVTMALRLVDTTIVAILGGFEPLTAMIVGILVLGEPYDAFTITGGILVLVASTIITIRK